MRGGEGESVLVGGQAIAEIFRPYATGADSLLAFATASGDNVAIELSNLKKIAFATGGERYGVSGGDGVLAHVGAVLAFTISETAEDGTVSNNTYACSSIGRCYLQAGSRDIGDASAGPFEVGGDYYDRRATDGSIVLARVGRSSGQWALVTVGASPAAVQAAVTSSRSAAGVGTRFDAFVPLFFDEADGTEGLVPTYTPKGGRTGYPYGHQRWRVSVFAKCRSNGRDGLVPPRCRWRR